LLLFAHQDALQIFGLGLMVPGGGFLAHADICTGNGIGHVAAWLCSVGALAFALLVWFGTGNVVLPPFVWLGSAFWAASMNHGAIQPGVALNVYYVLALFAAAGCLSMLAWFMFSGRQRRIDNDYLVRQTARLDTIFIGRQMRKGSCRRRRVNCGLCSSGNRCHNLLALFGCQVIVGCGAVRDVPPLWQGLSHRQGLCGSDFDRIQASQVASCLLGGRSAFQTPKNKGHRGVLYWVHGSSGSFLLHTDS
jgi:hypothetical protein